MKNKSILIVLICVIIPGHIFAQGFSVKGSVIDKSNNAPLSYATVQIANENYNTGTITNIDGGFSILVNKEGIYTINISCIGYK